MSNLAEFEFVAFDIMRKNYLFWILDVEIHLYAMVVDDAIREMNKAST